MAFPTMISINNHYDRRVHCGPVVAVLVATAVYIAAWIVFVQSHYVPLEYKPFCPGGKCLYIQLGSIVFPIWFTMAVIIPSPGYNRTDWYGWIEQPNLRERVICIVYVIEQELATLFTIVTTRFQFTGAELTCASILMALYFAILRYYARPPTDLGFTNMAILLSFMTAYNSDFFMDVPESQPSLLAPAPAATCSKQCPSFVTDPLHIICMVAWSTLAMILTFAVPVFLYIVEPPTFGLQQVAGVEQQVVGVASQQVAGVALQQQHRPTDDVEP